MHRHAFMSPETIQFADDTLIISEAHPIMLKVISHILGIYSELSGLRLNPARSSFVPIAVPSNLIQPIQQILSASLSNLPITYLGLPLTVNTLRKIHYQPMLSAIHNRLQGWTSNSLSHGGRITMVKAVLSAMPLHYMHALKIPAGSSST